jgi:Ricin-type beta-trefoil lectin domain
MIPNCTAGDSTIDNPTSITIIANTTALGSLLNVLPGLGLAETWNLSCNVNGSTVSVPGSYTVTTTAQSASTTVNLPAAVGSPEPNQCTISNLKVKTTLALSLGALGLSPFTVGTGATATTAVPGAVYQNEGATAKGANAVVCADDTGNANAGSKIQAYQCLSDLADYFVQTSSGQLVHNGDCLGLSGNKVLAPCAGGEQSQQWSQSTIGGTVTNQSTNTCLTAPSPKDGTQLTVASCGNGANQKWHIPAMS